jgi:hypothetical protein
MDAFQRQLQKVLVQERAILQTNKNPLQKKIMPLQKAVEEKIPTPLLETLEDAFFTAFQTLFEGGRPLIERTYDRRKILKRHKGKDELVGAQKTVKSLKELDADAAQRLFFNKAFVTLEGGGLGLLGMGMPDIVILIAVMIKNLDELALSYGFETESKGESLYMLRLISAAMTEGRSKVVKNRAVDDLAERLLLGLLPHENTEEVMRETAGILAKALLLAKFIQGYPVVGAVGSLVNFNTIHKTGEYAAIKYKKRYLLGKIKMGRE